MKTVKEIYAALVELLDELDNHCSDNIEFENGVSFSADKLFDVIAKIEIES